jgi:tetratricopeptide (TPR) repeat protein
MVYYTLVIGHYNHCNFCFDNGRKKMQNEFDFALNFSASRHSQRGPRARISPMGVLPLCLVLLIALPLVVRAQGASAPTPSRQSLSAADKAYNAGVAAVARNDFHAAASHLQKATGLAPADADALSLLGYVQLQLREYSLAVKSLQAAIVHRARFKDGSPAVTYNNLGIALYNTHRSAEAIAAYQNAMAHSPQEYGEARYNLAMTLLQEKRYEESLPHLLKLREQRTNDPAFQAEIARALAWAQQEMPTTALPNSKNSVASRDANLSLQQALGLASFSLADFERTFGVRAGNAQIRVEDTGSQPGIRCVMLQDVHPNQLAARNGLQDFDFVVACNDQRVTSATALATAISRLPVNSTVVFKIMHDGETVEVRFPVEDIRRTAAASMPPSATTGSAIHQPKSGSSSAPRDDLDDLLDTLDHRSPPSRAAESSKPASSKPDAFLGGLEDL